MITRSCHRGMGSEDSHSEPISLQSTKPLRVTLPSVRHVTVSPAARSTSDGVFVPLYSVPPTLSLSQQRSVSNEDALTRILRSASIVQRS